MLAELRTGITQSAEGSVNPARAGRFGELITGDAIGKYYELAKQGRLFLASMNAGAVLGTALTATAVTVTLYNPSGSGCNLSVIAGGVSYTTSAAGASTRSLVWAGNVDPAAAIPTAQTALTVRPVLLGAGFTSVGRAFSACTLPAAPVVVRVFPLGYVNVATTPTTVAPLAIIDYVDGALSLAPNTAVTIQGIATVNESGIVSIVWAEIPV